LRPFPIVAAATLLAACGSGGDGVIDRTFDACAPTVLDVSALDADQQTGVEDAIALWRAQGIDTLQTEPLDGAATIGVLFQDASPAFHGLYDDQAGIVYINSDLVDPSARAITISHELGHAFGLYHVAIDERVSVMNPGNLTVAPTEDDRVQIEAMWGPCTAQ